MRQSGWGRFPVRFGGMHAPRALSDLSAMLENATGLVARGNGRAYGDSAIGTTATVHMGNFNRIQSFDIQTGRLVAEAGVLLGDIIKSFMPSGWFPAVTPGTKFVTLGGAIASDVHGKNHHQDGSFGNYVDWIDLIGADGAVQRCSREENPELFGWTIGGMGLTGVILRAAVRLRRIETGWIRQRTLPATNLREVMEIFETNADAKYSVAWLDCTGRGSALGRSVVMLGEHATLNDLDAPRATKPFYTGTKKRKSVPFDFPGWVLNNWTVRAFNKLYYARAAKKPGTMLVDWDSYFYPLDAILGWNRIYGRKGFIQFQCVIPLEHAQAGLEALLDRIAQARVGSFLSVLKRFGAQDSPISFPMEGYTLALDFPVNKKTRALIEELDQIALAHGGRFYLAKDARMRAKTAHDSDPRMKTFADMRKANTMTSTLCSAQAERLDI